MTKKVFRCLLFAVFGALPMVMSAQSNNLSLSETERLLEKKKAQMELPEFKNQSEKDAWVKAQEKKQKESFNQKELSYPFTTIRTESEKDEWIRKNQSAYFGTPNEQQKIRVSRQEFESLPADKQNAMKNDSNYLIEQK